MKSWILFLLLSIKLFVAGQHVSEYDFEWNDKIDSLLIEFSKEKPYLGISVYTIQNDSIQFAAAEGFPWPKSKAYVGVDYHQYRIASISKSMTSYALMQMVQSNHIHLDSSIYSYGIDYPKKKWDITVRQLANHTAGIRGYKQGEFYSTVNFESVSEAIKVFAEDPLAFEPGTKYMYSSFGYNLLSHVMERAAGVPYLELMDSLVFLPIGLERTQPEFENKSKQRSTYGYYVYFRNGEMKKERFVNNSIKWAGGGFISSAKDVAIFGNYVHHHSEIDDSLKGEFFTENIVGEDSTSYGLGWVVKTDIHGQPWIGHTGGGVGASAILATYPQDSLSITILCNTSGLNLKVLSAQIRDVLLSNED
jgi:CubicO group peptidase (beta-lactamase class C family)